MSDGALNGGQRIEPRPDARGQWPYAEAYTSRKRAASSDELGLVRRDIAGASAKVGNGMRLGKAVSSVFCAKIALVAGSRRLMAKGAAAPRPMPNTHSAWAVTESLRAVWPVLRSV